MTTGTDVVREGFQILGIRPIRYGSWDCSARCNPWVSHCMDCSGFTSAILNALNIGAGCEGSFFQSRRFHAAGTGMPFEQAINTPGAFGFQGINEGQGGTPGVDEGHVVVFVGDGVHTIEARGHWAGVGLFNARSLVYTWCGMPPGAFDPISVPVPPVPSPVPLPRLAVQEESNMSMLALPHSMGTQAGRVPTARAVRAYNFVLLENGARLHNDIPVDGTGADKSRHWWAPSSVHADIPGAQIVDIADLRVTAAGMTPENALAIAYATPSGAIVTYKEQIGVPAA